MNQDKQLFYNQIADNWDSLINQTETNKRLHVIFDTLFQGINLKNKKFLEVGCGLGFFSQRANILNAKVTGVDIGPKLVKKCQKLIPQGTFKTASADKLPFPDNSFDVVLCTEVLEHVSHQSQAFSELARVTKPRGNIIITTPNLFWKPFFNLLSMTQIRPYHGIENWLSFTDLRKLITENNLQIKKEIGFNFIFPHPLLDQVEKIPIMKHVMINIGYTLKK